MTFDNKSATIALLLESIENAEWNLGNAERRVQLSRDEVDMEENTIASLKDRISSYTQALEDIRGY